MAGILDLGHEIVGPRHSGRELQDRQELLSLAGLHRFARADAAPPHGLGMSVHRDPPRASHVCTRSRWRNHPRNGNPSTTCRNGTYAATGSPGTTLGGCGHPCQASASSSASFARVSRSFQKPTRRGPSASKSAIVSRRRRSSFSLRMRLASAFSSSLPKNVALDSRA